MLVRRYGLALCLPACRAVSMASVVSPCSEGFVRFPVLEKSSGPAGSVSLSRIGLSLCAPSLPALVQFGVPYDGQRMGQEVCLIARVSSRFSCIVLTSLWIFELVDPCMTYVASLPAELRSATSTSRLYSMLLGLSIADRRAFQVHINATTIAIEEVAQITKGALTLQNALHTMEVSTVHYRTFSSGHTYPTSLYGHPSQDTDANDEKPSK